MHERNENQCLHRYRRLSQLGVNRKTWSSEEDETVTKLIKKVGKNWKLLSESLGTKTGKQIRERFINKLDPKIKKEEWTDEEDRTLIELYSQLGSRWSEISKRLPGRPENKIKNRFYSFIQKNYDIKFRILEDKNESTPVKEEHPVLKEINREEFPSINDIDLEIRDDNMDFNKENFVSNSKAYLKSLIKIDDDWSNKFKSLNEFVSQELGQ